MHFIINIQTEMSSNLQTFKFVFSAEIGELILKANISSPTFVTWKRSQESAISQIVDLTAGKANFNNEVLKLPVNMYFDKDANCFQEKKSSFSFTMKTPKGEKTAGVVYVDLSKMLNNKITELNEDFPLEKCPVKDSSVKIKITSECFGEKSDDTMSQASASVFAGSQSTLSINSKAGEIESVKENSSIKSKGDSKDKEISELKEKLANALRENQTLKKELENTKNSLKGDNAKEELLQSKNVQSKLEEEINNLRKNNQDHEKEIEDLRKKMEDTYNNLYTNLSKHFL